MLEGSGRHRHQKPISVGSVFSHGSFVSLKLQPINDRGQTSTDVTSECMYMFARAAQRQMHVEIA